MADKKEKAFIERVFLQDWSQTRRIGRLRFAVITGTLIGAPTAFGIILYPLILRGHFDSTKATTITVFCILLGWFFGFMLWRENEKKFLADDHPVKPPAPTPDAPSKPNRPPAQ